MRNRKTKNVVTMIMCLLLLGGIAGIRTNAVSAAEPVQVTYDANLRCLSDDVLYYKVLDEEQQTVQVGRGDLNLYGARQTALKDTEATSIDIPEEVEYDGRIYKVVNVSCYAFYQCKSIRSVTLGENITDIEQGAFKDCTNITYIGWNAVHVNDFTSAIEYGNMFSNVGKDRNGIRLVFGDKVEHIPARAFYTSSSISQHCDKITSIEFGENIRTIGEYAFAYSSNLTTVSLPEHLQQLPAHCFEKCEALERVDISDRIIDIGTRAFYGCSSIRELVFGAGLETIGKDAFSGCSGVNDLYWNIRSMADLEPGNGIFSNLGAQSDGLSITFGESVERVPANLFYQNGANIGGKGVRISEIVFENSETGSVSIGENAFRNCRYLEEIVLGKNITEIGSNAFNGCSGVTGIVWNAEQMQDFKQGNGVFEGLGSAVQEGAALTIGSSVKKLPAYAFVASSETLGKNVNISSMVCESGSGSLEIGECAFRSVESLKELDFSDRTVEIGASAYLNCKGLDRLDLTGQVKTIGASAFSGCSKVGVIEIGESVQAIGSGAFSSIGTGKAQAVCLYNCSKQPVNAGVEYSGGNLEIYGLATLEHEEHGEYGWDADPFTEYNGMDFVKKDTQAVLEVKPNYYVHDAWVIDQVTLNGAPLNAKNDKKQYDVLFSGYAIDIRITYKERTEPFLAAIGTTGYDSLQDAVDAVTEDGTVIAICSDQLISKPVNISRSMSFTVDETLQQVTLRNGVAADAMLKIGKEAEVALSGNMIWKGNTAADVMSDRPMVIVDGALDIGEGVVMEGQSGNSSTGGAVCNQGTVTLKGGIIRNNRAQYGAGIYCAPSSELIVESGMITGNLAVKAGAGIYAQDTVTLSGSDNESIQVADNNLTDGTTASNIYLKKTGFNISGAPKGTSRISIEYAETTTKASYLTDGGATEAWVSVMTSDKEAYALGVDEAGKLFYGYKIIYNPDYEEDGVPVESVIRAAHPDGVIGAFPELKRNGYIVTGWYRGTTKMLETGKITSATTLTARWQEVVARIGDSIYSSISDALKDAQNGDVIVLIKDTTVSQPVKMEKDCVVTIDGAGYSVTRVKAVKMFDISAGTVKFKNVRLDGAEMSASALYVDGGTVELLDDVLIENCVLIGTVNGSSAVHLRTGSVKLNGGIIQNNKAINGAGVYVDEGTFECIKGEIRSNTASKNGGGIYVKAGSVKLTGGRISENSCTSEYGGGIYINSAAAAEVSVAGNPVVTGNTRGGVSNNVYLAAADKKLVVSGVLEQTAEIGITLAKAILPSVTKDTDGSIQAHNDVVLTSGAADRMKDGVLRSDSTDYIVVQDAGEWNLRKNEFSVVYDPSGGTIKIGNKNKEKHVEIVQYDTTMQEVLDKISGATITTTAEDNNVLAYWYDSSTGKRLLPSAKLKGNMTINVRWVKGNCAEPQFSLESGTYIGTRKLTLTSPTVGCKIYYTVDGTEPSIESTAYTKEIELTDDVTVRAICAGDSYKDSEVSECTYTIRVVNAIALSDTPTFLYKGRDNIAFTANVEVGNTHTGTDVIWYLADRELTVSGENGEVTNTNEIQKTSVTGVTLTEQGVLESTLEAAVDSVIVCAEAKEDSSKKVTRKIILKKPLQVTYDSGYEVTEEITDEGWYKPGEKTKVKAPVQRDGYTFDGWKVGEKIYQPEEEIELQDTDICLTAQWIENKVNSVAILQNDAPVPEAGIVLTKGENITLQAKVEVQGNISNGVNWTVQKNQSDKTVISDGVLTVDVLEPSDELQVIASSVYDADKKATVKITLKDRTWEVTGYLEDEAETAEWNQTIAEGKAITLPACSKEKAGYTFAGWRLKKTDDTTLYKPGEEVTISDKNYAFYAVWEKNEVTEISFIMGEKQVKPGETADYRVEVSGTGIYSEEVIWKLEGNTSGETIITPEGTKCNLAVSGAETADELTLRVISSENSEVEAEYAVSVYAEVTALTAGTGAKELYAGETAEFEVGLQGIGNYQKDLDWAVSGQQSEETGITPEGLKCTLKVAPTEKAAQLVLTATSRMNPEKKAEFLVTILSKVTSIVFTDGKEEVKAGETAVYEVQVQGVGNYAGDVVWTLNGQKSDATKISPDGSKCVLSVGEDEDSEALSLVAAVENMPEMRASYAVKIQKENRQATTQTSEEATTQASEEATTQASEEATTQASEEATTQASEEATTQASEEATTQVSEEATTQASEEATTQASEEATTQASEEATTQAGEQDTTQSQQPGTQAPKPQATTAKPVQQATTEKKTQSVTQQATTEAAKTEKTVKAGVSFTLNGMKYKVTSVEKKTVAFTAPVSKKKTKITIPATVKYEGITWKVTSMAKNCLKKNTKLKKVTIGKNVEKIGANALNGDTNCNSIVIKSSKLKSVGKNALKGIHKNAVIKVPKKKLTDYKKLLKKKGQKTTVKIKA